MVRASLPFVAWLLFASNGQAQTKAEVETSLERAFDNVLRCLENERELQQSELACDSGSFIKFAIEAERLRVRSRIKEAEFAKLAKEFDTVVLDARSAESYKQIHAKGSINLPFTDFSEERLSQIIPSKHTRILIYCSNNFEKYEELNSAGMPIQDLVLRYRKGQAAGLNISTFITLFIYGYENIRELETIVDTENSPIEFEKMATRDSPIENRR